MPPILFDVGYKDITLEGFHIEIVYRKSHKQIGVLFREPVECVVEVELSHLRRRNIRNPYLPSIYGVACIGAGEYSSRNPGEARMDSAYRHWFGMLTRVYKKERGYENCRVADEWLNFQNFAKWWYNYPQHTNLGWCLDKDLLRSKGDFPIYSPDTCCIIPKDINIAIKGKNKKRVCSSGVYKSGKRFVAQRNAGDGNAPYIGTFDTEEEAFMAYKLEKEAYLKTVAEKWKGVICDKAYLALLNYEVT